MSSAGRDQSKPWRRTLAVFRVAVIVGLLGPIAWDEFHPRSLRDADAAYARGDLSTALGQALGHLQGHPWSRAATLDAARCFSRLDHADWAEPYYQKVGLGRVGLADLHVRALGLFRANHRDQAVSAYNEILKLHPDDILALRRLAAVRIAQGAASEAMTLADRLSRIPDGEVIGHTLAGTIAHDTGDTEHSVEEFLKVLALDPTLARMPLSPRSMFWTYLGQDLLTSGRADEARTYLERALTEGKNASLAAFLASAHRQLGDLDEAERCWKLATSWDPRLPGPWLGLGRLALQRGRPEQAIEPLQRAIDLTPRDAGPIYSLGQARRQMGDVAEADRLLRLADELRTISGATTTGTMSTTPAPRPSTPPPTDRKEESR